MMPPLAKPIFDDIVAIFLAQDNARTEDGRVRLIQNVFQGIVNPPSVSAAGTSPQDACVNIVRAFWGLGKLAGGKLAICYLLEHLGEDSPEANANASRVLARIADFLNMPAAQLDAYNPCQQWFLGPNQSYPFLGRKQFREWLCQMSASASLDTVIIITGTQPASGKSYSHRLIQHVGRYNGFSVSAPIDLAQEVTSSDFGPEHLVRLILNRLDKSEVEFGDLLEKLPQGPRHAQELSNKLIRLASRPTEQPTWLVIDGLSKVTNTTARFADLCEFLRRFVQDLLKTNTPWRLALVDYDDADNLATEARLSVRKDVVVDIDPTDVTNCFRLLCQVRGKFTDLTETQLDAATRWIYQQMNQFAANDPKKPSRNYFLAPAIAKCWERWEQNFGQAGGGEH